MLRPTFINLSLSFALTLIAGPAFGQTPLSAVFHTALTAQLAAASTVAVSIAQGGIVPIYSASTTVQPGSWISIYGSNMASAPASASGGFPTQLGGTSVMIDGKPAYLLYVSPTLIDAQAPDDTSRGTVAVSVTAPAGSASSTATLGDVGPAWCVLGGKYVAGEIVRLDGSGSQGGGSFDFLGPAGNSLGFPTVPAKANDIVELFGTGFGPTNTSVPAGQIVPPNQIGQITATDQVQVIINGVTVTPSFVGIVATGLFQVNVTIPSGLGTGDMPLLLSVGGVQTPTGIFISLQ